MLLGLYCCPNACPAPFYRTPLDPPIATQLHSTTHTHRTTPDCLLTFVALVSCDAVLVLGCLQVGKGIGHFFGAWRVDGFRDKEEFKGEMDKWIKTFRNTKPEAGKRVLIPGDPERLAEVERRMSVRAWS